MLIPNLHPPLQSPQWSAHFKILSLSLQIPSILSEELKHNLFMCPRMGGICLKDALGLPHHCNESTVLAELRKRKDAYKPFD